MYLGQSLRRLPHIFKRIVPSNLSYRRMLVLKCDSHASGPRPFLASVSAYSFELCLSERRTLHTHRRKRVGVVTPLFLRAHLFPDRIALVDENGVYRYGDLMSFAELVTDRIADHLGGPNDDTCGERVCILCPNNASHVVAQLAVWMSGSVAVALSPHHPPTQLEYFITDSQCRMVVTTEDLVDKVQPVASKLGVTLLSLTKSDYCGRQEQEQSYTNSVLVNDAVSQLKERHAIRLNRLQQLRSANKFKNKQAFIFYTSGTTGSPKVSISVLINICDFW